MKAPLFNVIAALLPIGGAVYATMKAQRSADTMGGAIGIALGAYLLFAVACVVGEVLAVIALVRGERPGWLSTGAALLNLTVVLPPLYFFLFKK